MRLLSAMLVLILASGLGCAARTDVFVVDRDAFHGPKVPPTSVAERFEKASAEDSQLMLGFFSAPGIGDGSEDELLPALKGSIASATWDAPGRRAFREDGWLVVFQHEDVLRQIHPWLQEHGRKLLAERGIVSTQLRILRLAEGSSVLEDVVGIRDSGASNVHTVTDAQWRELADHDEVTVICAPFVSVVSGERATIQVANETAYVKDFQIYYVNDAKVADPVVDTVMDGIVAQLRPTVQEDQTVDLELQVVVSDLAGITATEVRVSENQTVTIHLPDIALVETRAHFRQQRGATSLVLGPKLRGEQIVIVATVE